MCLGLFGFCYGISPYVWLIVMPMIGSFCGSDPVLRLSILFLLLTWCAKLLPRHLIMAEPLLQLGALVVLLALPVSVTPQPFVYMYSTLLWLTEPLWLLFEVLGVLQLSFRVSTELVAQMERRPQIAKGCIILLSVICYLTMLNFFWSVVLSKVEGVKMCLAPLVVLLTMVHIAVWFSDAGVLSDAALVSVFSMALLYSMLFETHRTKWADSAEDWRSFGEDISFSRLIFAAVGSCLRNLSSVSSFLTKLLSPWFVAATVVRCYSVMLAVGWLRTWLQKDDDENSFLFDEEEEDDDDDDDYDDFTDPHELEGWGRKLSSVVAWRSPLLTRLVTIFVYTQLVVHHVEGPAFDFALVAPVLNGVSPARLMQVVLVNGLYLHHLYNEHYSNEYE